MKSVVFGSVNIDRTYYVEDFVHAGETISAGRMDVFCGGKGFNQAIALARAGCEVYFAGAIGEDGGLLYDSLKENGVDVTFLKRIPGPTGHAVIQVTSSGQNNIIILAGANGTITHEDVDQVLAAFSAGDLIVLQNEISRVDYIIERAKDKGMIIALNPSPFNSKIKSYDLSKVDYLLVNEVEGALIVGSDNPEIILNVIHEKYPNANIVLTLGASGSMYMGKDGQKFSCGIYKTNVVDTTAAGDTYTGYFLAEALSSGNIEEALKIASVASGISVSRPGASQSIPFKEEVEKADYHQIG